MYYVIYVGSGKEADAQTAVKNAMSADLYHDCFYPTRHMRKKIRGQWKDLLERLIPGYIFVESDDIETFYLEIKKMPFLIKLLGKQMIEDEMFYYAFNEKEEAWLKKLIGNDNPKKSKKIQHNPTIELSQVGFDENDQVVILSGPLLAMTGQVKKIDLHKRRAEVEVEFMGRLTSIYMGIDILQKTEV